jgi:YHS domain-containing protein
LENVAFAVKKDLVCGMPLSAGISDTAHYKGGIYGFCAVECKAEFVKNPEAYLTAK